MKIKHTLKNFIWNCLQQILPINAAIFQRTGKREPICNVVKKRQNQWNMHYYFASMHRKYGNSCQYNGMESLNTERIFGLGSKRYGKLKVGRTDTDTLS